jgi:hypothetical protein
MLNIQFKFIIFQKHINSVPFCICEWNDEMWHLNMEFRIILQISGKYLSLGLVLVAVKNRLQIMQDV